ANNYRSFAPIVRTFQKFSVTMGGGDGLAGSWSPSRGDGGDVTLTVAPTLAAEAEAIRDKINEFRTKGVPYSDQAILGRSHLMLARLTEALEQLGVPLLYLGDLFERDEIRDLLSLIAIDAEFGGIGLTRVAALPAYQATREDALSVIRWARTNRVQIFPALERISEIEGVSESGRRGLAKLATELRGLANASPWALLTTWLFERSDYLLSLIKADNAISQQNLVAIYHLLKVCSEQATLGDASRKRFLERVRRIEALNQDNSYRAVASEAADADAVRVMTIHGSKGLEFGAVHFPALAARYMPTSRQPVRCPPPASLPQLAIASGDHDAEEECLFFVALSRARDYLSLSRAERYTTQNSNQSKFLPLIASVVPSSRRDAANAKKPPSIRFRPPAPRERYDERELSLYLQCPARYRYEWIEDLRGVRDESAYLRFHRCVYLTIRWLEEEREKGRIVATPEALARLARDWQTEGPVDHPFEKYYRATAEEMVKRMATAIASETGQYGREEWAVSIGDRFVLITPDRVLVTPDGVVHVQRIRTGRQTKTESERPIYALLREGAAARYPGKTLRIETFYLATGAKVMIEATRHAEGLDEYATAIAAIERGDFEPAPDPRRCPNCQCYFVCPD
nr:ATP-dependent helicase [Betaproteobacteria bacterium]